MADQDEQKPSREAKLDQGDRSGEEGVQQAHETPDQHEENEAEEKASGLPSRSNADHELRQESPAPSADSEQDVSQDERRKKEPSVRERLASAANQMDGTLIPSNIPTGRIVITIAVFALLYILHLDEVRSYLLGEVTYERLVEAGAVLEDEKALRRTVAEEFETWTRETYYAELDRETYRGRIIMLVDPNCPHCRRAFESTGAMNEAGITVEYITIPTSMGNALSMEAAASIYCAPEDERREAFETEMRQDVYLSPECEFEPVVQIQMERARDLGADGVRPWSITEDGRAVVGYRDIEQWTMILDEGGRQ